MQKFGIAIHGGAISVPSKLDTKGIEERLSALRDIVSSGYALLEKGCSSLDAVEHAVTLLEDCSLFNAGKGSVTSRDGTFELDASIIDGTTLQAGSVVGLRRIQNPVRLARRIMEKTPHVMLSGSGAESFAREEGFPFVDPSYFHTEKEALSHKGAMGTVGAVALDSSGHLAAATSTGGMRGKMPGRVSDTPIVGAGCYANDRTCAVSTTGHGEYFIRGVVAYDISALIEYKGLSVEAATTIVIKEKLSAAGGEGGAIAIDSAGNIALIFNSPAMSRAARCAGKDPIVAVF